MTSIQILLIDRDVFIDIRLAQINHNHHEAEEVEDESESESQQRPAFGQRRVNERRLAVAAFTRRLCGAKEIRALFSFAYCR